MEYTWLDFVKYAHNNTVFNADIDLFFKLARGHYKAKHARDYPSNDKIKSIAYRLYKNRQKPIGTDSLNSLTD